MYTSMNYEEIFKKIVGKIIANVELDYTRHNTVGMITFTDKSILVITGIGEYNQSGDLDFYLEEEPCL